MSLDLETRMRRFHASAPQTVHRIQTLEISHSAMTQTFHLWREPYAGTAGGNAMQSANIEITLAGSAGNLDQKFNIKLGLVDIEDLFRSELDLIPVDTAELIRLVYREFLSDDLTHAEATVALQAESVTYAKGGASISAVSPRLSMLRTGELYTPKDISMLRAFL